MIFAKPPLVELIAELRWGPQPSVPSSGGPGQGVQNLSMPLAMTNRVEEWFMQFGAKISVDGYTRFERLVPTGFPLMPFQPVYRYRKNAPEDGTSLYQLGPGLFSANITPPYKSWDQFEPIVKNGVEKVLQSRTDIENKMPFRTVLLRYIDAFGPEFLKDESSLDFLITKLGFKIELPKVFDKFANSSIPVKGSLNFGVPLKDNFVMSINVGEGIADGKQAVVLDTTVAKTIPVQSVLVDVMATFNDARSIIHETFIEITKPIASIMEPIEEKGND
ncbi:MAG: TIGR04255 family protein [Desulfobulbus sp.]|nr:TIGR04255 family protein [Desulfobulbus sp.]